MSQVFTTNFVAFVFFCFVFGLLCLEHPCGYVRITSLLILYGCIWLASLGRPRCGNFFCFSRTNVGTYLPHVRPGKVAYFVFQDECVQEFTHAPPGKKPDTSSREPSCCDVSAPRSLGADPRCTDVTTRRLTWWCVWFFFQVERG